MAVRFVLILGAVSFRAVGSAMPRDRFGSSGMLAEKSGQIVNFTVDDHPAVGYRIVLGYLNGRENRRFFRNIIGYCYAGGFITAQVDFNSARRPERSAGDHNAHGDPEKDQNE